MFWVFSRKFLILLSLILSSWKYCGYKSRKDVRRYIAVKLITIANKEVGVEGRSSNVPRRLAYIKVLLTVNGIVEKILVRWACESDCRTAPTETRISYETRSETKQ